MAETHHFLAIDFGAESGRGVLVNLREGKAEMEEIHRWPNTPVRLGGTLYWDFPFLYSQMLASMRICADRGVKLSGISPDTWGVDFGLLDGDGKLLSLPVHYRDSRTDGIHEYSDPIMTRQEIYAATGYEPWPISSLFQLLAMQRDKSPLLDAAKTFLNMPDLFNYFLTGKARGELSIANNSNLLGTDCKWCREIIDRFNLPDIFPELIEPATVLAELAACVADETHLARVPVIATCGHDTGAVAAAVPAQGDDWAFLSCGTWSILATLLDTPIATPRALELGFANEYTAGGWYMCRNILGLWLVQELKRKWDVSSDPWDYDRMTAAAIEAEADDFAGLVNVADESLLAPADMEEALLAVLAGAGQGKPDSRGQLVRCVLESLALECAWRLEAMAELTGRKKSSLYMVGGGIANKLLCQFTADACGMPVHAGADQCTAMGNGLCQALAIGALTNRSQIREVMRNSCELTTYEPRDESVWQDKRGRYRELMD